MRPIYPDHHAVPFDPPPGDLLRDVSGSQQRRLERAKEHHVDQWFARSSPT